jgi:hypothetical protein
VQKGTRSPSGDASDLIGKLVRAGYLQPTQRRNAKAIESAIFQMKEDLRVGSYMVGRRDDEPPAA